MQRPWIYNMLVLLIHKTYFKENMRTIKTEGAIQQICVDNYGNKFLY